jgi:hypothetical protein
VEHCPIFQRLLHPNGDPVPAFRAYFETLLPLYIVLERTIQEASRRHPGMARLDRKDLRKSNLLLRDLDRMGQPAGLPIPVASGGGCSRLPHDPWSPALEPLVEQAPHRLAAWWYVRHFGDLGGGRMISAAFLRRTGVELLFGRLDPFNDANEARVSLRTSLDSLELDRSETLSVIEEAVRAFDLHAEILGQL